MKKRKNNKKIITVCCSMHFYEKVYEVEKELKKRGFKVKIPKTMYKMKRTGNYNLEEYKTWYKDESHYYKKKALMNDHFKKVIKGDAILIVNEEKNGVKGYIGGNTLMEMVIAYHYKKPIFVLNQIIPNFPFEEEIKGMGAVFINQDLSKVTIK